MVSALVEVVPALGEVVSALGEVVPALMVAAAEQLRRSRRIIHFAPRNRDFAAERAETPAASK